MSCFLLLFFAEACGIWVHSSSSAVFFVWPLLFERSQEDKTECPWEFEELQSETGTENLGQFRNSVSTMFWPNDIFYC